MADIRLLERTLASNVAWNKARINFVAKFLVALIQVKSVNLVEVASVFAGSAQPASHYKRAQRFLRFFELPYAGVAAFEPFRLTLLDEVDRERGPCSDGFNRLPFFVHGAIKIFTCLPDLDVCLIHPV